MEYLVMECSLGYAVVMDEDGRFLKVPNLGYTVGQRLDRVVQLPEQPVRPEPKPAPPIRWARWGALAACLCLLVAGGWFWQSPIGTVRMRINPDVQLKINRFDWVVAAEGLNEDGDALIRGYRAYGKEMETAAEELADRAVELGYLRDGGRITLTIGSEREDWRLAAEEKLVQELENHFDRRVTVALSETEPEAVRPPEPAGEASGPPDGPPAPLPQEDPVPETPQPPETPDPEPEQTPPEQPPAAPDPDPVPERPSDKAPEVPEPPEEPEDLEDQEDPEDLDEPEDREDLDDRDEPDEPEEEPEEDPSEEEEADSEDLSPEDEEEPESADPDAGEEDREDPDEPEEESSDSDAGEEDEED